jgi:NitT/TauT family transport system permease protein
MEPASTATDPRPRSPARKVGPATPALAMRRIGWLVLLAALWEALARTGRWPPWIFPGPIEVTGSLERIAADGTLWRAIGTSMARLGVGYGLSLVVGIPLGLLLARNRWVDESIGTIVLGLQALPSICWLPVALLWFGLSETAILFVVVAGSVLSVALAAEAGVRNLNPIWIRAGRTLGAKGLRLYTSVLFPASLPALVGGAKLGWTFAWRSLMAAELLYVSGGLGQLLQAGRELNDVSRVFAVMVVIIALGLSVEKLLFAPLERHVRERFGTDQP